MVRTEVVEYDVAGTRMAGYLAIDESVGGGARHPGVLLSHEGGGLDDNVRSRAERLAALGYVAFALDYYGGGRQPPMEEVQPRMIELIADGAGAPEDLGAEDLGDLQR